MSLQSYLSRRNFKISTLDDIFSYFGLLCGGGTAQERTATGRRGSKHGWVVTPATVGRQPSQRDPSPADGRPTGLAATLAPRRRRAAATANLVAFRGLWLFFTRQYSLRGGGTILWELGKARHNFTASTHRNEGQGNVATRLDAFELESKQFV